MHIAVLFGGVSEEREVSLRSGARVQEALSRRGHTVQGIELAAPLPDDDAVAHCRAADAVFLALHGGAGEDGRVQAALEAGGVWHYTGSDARGSALAMEKTRAKAAVQAVGVPVAKGWRWPEERAQIRLPCVAKPVCGGSSVGLLHLEREEDLERVPPDANYFCESYLAGREFSVGVFRGNALPPVEIRPVCGVYDYAHKYTPGATEELCPAPVTSARCSELKNWALVAFAALGLRDYARIDFKEDGAGNLCFLEANTLPGMTQTSLFPLAADVQGIGYEVLCEEMAVLAAARGRP